MTLREQFEEKLDDICRITQWYIRRHSSVLARLRRDLGEDDFIQEVIYRCLRYASRNPHKSDVSLTYLVIWQCINILKTRHPLTRIIDRKRVAWTKPRCLALTAVIMNTAPELSYEHTAYDIAVRRELLIMLQQQLAMALNHLSEDELHLLDLRYGLTDGISRTYDECATHTTCRTHTRQGVQQLLLRVISRMQVVMHDPCVFIEFQSLTKGEV